MPQKVVTFDISDLTVAVVDAVQAICRDKRIRLAFGHSLLIESIEDTLTATVTVISADGWGSGTRLILHFHRPDTSKRWLASGPASFRFGIGGTKIPMSMQGRKVEFEVIPIFPSNRDDRLWRPARYSIRNMNYTGRHVEGVAAQMV